MPQVFPKALWKPHIPSRGWQLLDAADCNRTGSVTSSPQYAAVAYPNLLLKTRNAPVDERIPTKIIVDIKT
jgi:hypothetical protein